MNPDHVRIARGIEAACWMAGRAHDYPEQLAAGLAVHAVQEQYYQARRPEVNRGGRRERRGRSADRH